MAQRLATTMQININAAGFKEVANLFNELSSKIKSINKVNNINISSNIKNISNETKKLPADINKIKVAFDSISGPINKANKETEKTRILMNDIVPVVKKINSIKPGNVFDMTLVKKVNDGITRIKVGSEYTIGSINKLNKASGSLLKAFSNDLINISNNMRNWGKNIQWTGQRLTYGLTVPIIGFATITTKSALQFEESMAGVRAALSETGVYSEENYNIIKNAVLDMSKKSVKSASDISNGLYELVSAGYNAGQAISMLPSVVEFATAGIMETGDAASFAARMYSAWGETGISLQEIMDVTSIAVQKSNAHFVDFTHNLEMASQFAQQAGLSYQELAVSIMVLSDRGAPLARIGFNISQMFSQMIKPSSQAQEVLSQLGYSFYDTNNKMKPMGQILNDLRNKLKDYNEESQAQMLNILFNIRAGRAALALIKDTGKSYDDVTESIKNSAGATRLMAEAIKQTPYGMYQIAINNLNANLIVLGNYLLPIVTDLISTLTSYVALAVDWWSNLSESTKSTIISFIKFVAIGGPILVTLGVITEAFGTLGKALLWLSSTAIPKLAIALKYLILNPVGLVITALGTLLYYLGFFDISLGKTTNNIQDYSKLIGDSVTNAFGKMGKAMEAGTGEYKKNSDEMAKDAEKLADKMQDATEKMTESLQELDLQIQKSEFTFKESLAEMIKSHQDKVNELDEQLASEKGEFDRIQNDKLKSFQDKTFDMKKEHERRLEDLQYELRQELLRGRKADQDRIYDLRTRISREIQDYNDEFAQLQQEYQQDTLNAKAEHDKKTADLQARLNEETSLLQKHSTEVLMVKDFQFRDEIQKLVDSHTEQMAEYDAQKAKIKKNFEDQQKEVNTATGDMFGNMVTQAGQTVEGINNQFKNIGTNLNFDEFNKIGQEVGKQTSDGAGEGFMKGGFWKILRFLGEAAKTTFFPNIAKQEEQKFVYELLKQSAPLNNEEMSQKINDFIKNNKHSGGLIHAQSGTIIPGASPLRDRVPVMAEPGEGIMSREAVNNFLRNGTTGGDTYNYNIEIRPGTMIATRGEQREFAREIKRLISEDNMRTATYLS